MLWIVIIGVLDGLTYLHVLLKWDTTTSGSMKKEIWPEQSGGLIAVMWEEQQNSVAEGARWMRELCTGQHFGEKAYAASGFAVHALGLHVLRF